MTELFYIETMGCQMNKLDSELVAAQLEARGYRRTLDCAAADIIIFNTCSVRQHAEEKVLSKIGQLQRRHRCQPHLVLAVIGCMAQRLGPELLQLHAEVDIVCGPGRLHRLADMIAQALTRRRQFIALNDRSEDNLLEEFDCSRPPPRGDNSFQAYVRVMRGCNNFCSYCVVPYVRGPEQCRPLENILAESRRLVHAGVKEITLLGQTVNSYQFPAGGRMLGLADVLEAVHEIDGLQRLRFITSYPRDFDERILHALADLPRVCAYLHLPAQSGSNRILRAMNRRYSVEQYLEVIERARLIVPDLTLAGDFIVGYCGEEPEDFEATMQLLQRVRYKNCFLFRYSPRPGTLADKKFADNVPDAEKRRRHTELLALQNQISLEHHRCFIGRDVEILVEGPSKKPHLDHLPPDGSDRLQLTGRTPGDHIVVFEGSRDLIGRIISVKVTRASALTLFAERKTAG